MKTTRNMRPQFRALTFKREAVNEEARTVELAFSSEEPYQRPWGLEVLAHEPAAVRLGRLQNAGALLLDHDPRRHIGVIEQASIGDDRVGRAVVRFGKSADAEEAFRDVLDGIRRHVSVGYLIHKLEENADTEEVRVTDWEPFEVSLVAIPADPTVGVGRSAALDEVPVEVTRHGPAPHPQPKGPTSMSENNGKTPEQLERERVSGIVTIGEQFAKYVNQKDIADAIRNGRSVEAFKDQVMTAMETRHTDTSGVQLGMSRKEVQRYSFGRALVASITGDWSQAGFEREASEAMAKLVGRAPEGFYIPFDTFRRDFNVGTATEAGNLVATEMRGDLYVDALRAAIVMSGLGVRILPGLTGNVDIPRKTVVSTISRVTEIQAAGETQPATAKLTLSPKRFGGFVEVSKQALIQSAIALEAMIRDDLLQSAAVDLENQAINGNGTAPQILGLRNTTSIATVVQGPNGLAPSWGAFVDLESACADANAEPDRLAGYLINTRVRGAAKKVQKGTNLGFIWDGGEQPLNGYRAAVTNNVPRNLTRGTSTTVCSMTAFSSDWSMAVLGLFGAPDVIVDPYTLASTGQVRITLNQFADFGIRQPGAFAVTLDLLA